MHPKDLSIKDFTYSLPEQRIASYPLAERDASRMLIYKQGHLEEDIYKNIATHLPAGSFLVFNNSKVVEARLLFQKSSGGSIELFCLEPAGHYTDITTAMMQKEKVYWQCMVGGASKWKHGQVSSKTISTGKGALELVAEYVEKKAGSFVINLSWQPSELSFAEVLHLAGAIPLPPYIKRNAEKSDAERYQTIYAIHEGSVAAPTAGLHFTKAIFAALAAKEIHTGFVTLHVGAGTFKPVKSETMAAHEMHAEFIDVDRSTIEQLIQANDNIIAVGTTSLRTIESLYWLGVKAVGGSQPAVDSLTLEQWEVYEMKEQSIPQRKSLEALLEWMDRNKTDRLLARTKLLIAPGYTPRLVKALVSNFHQPQSTLLLLVAALIGEDWKKVYNYALENDFRFLSYGDGCLLWINP